MRGLAESLDVEAMSLYHHVANKEALLDGIAQRAGGGDQFGGLRTRSGDGPRIKAKHAHPILTARTVMVRHKWAPALLESWTAINPAALRYIHGLLEVFSRRRDQLRHPHHALHALKYFRLHPELFEPAPGVMTRRSATVDGENGHRTPASRRDDG